MLNNRQWLFRLSLLTCLFAWSAVEGSIIPILGNGPEFRGTAEIIGGPGNSVNYTAQARGFLNELIVHNLVSVDIALSVGGGNMPKLQIYDDQAGSPGSPIAGFLSNPTPSLITGVGTIYNYQLSQSLFLQPGTKYWLVVSDAALPPAATQFDWLYATNGPPVTLNQSGVKFIGSKATTTTQPNWYSVDFANEAMFILNSEVPEPSTYAMGTVCVLSLGLIERWRKRRK